MIIIIIILYFIHTQFNVIFYKVVCRMVAPLLVSTNPTVLFGRGDQPVSRSDGEKGTVSLDISSSSSTSRTLTLFSLLKGEGLGGGDDGTGEGCWDDCSCSSSRPFIRMTSSL